MNTWNTDRDDTTPRRKTFLTWLGRIVRWIRNFFAFLGLAYTIIPIVLIWAIFHSSEPQKASREAVKDSSKPKSLWLVLDSRIIEHEPRMGEEFFRQIFGRDDGIYLPTVRSTLRNAGADKLIKDMQIVLDGLHGSPADLEELRGIIADFKASGKPITSWVAHMDNAALMIASATDKINLNPVAEVSLPGPAFPMTYFGEALKKLGVEMQVIKTGKFKSAFEPFVSNEPSPESKEALSSVERSLRDLLVKNVAAGRKKQDSEVFLWFQESFFTPAKAKELGIVDELAYVPSIKDDDPESIFFDDYAGDESIADRLSKGYSLRPDEGLGLIEAVGEIVGASDGEHAITPGDMELELNWALHNDNVKAVVLRISSPGGSASAADFIWDRIRILNEKKPVIISMGSMAASGGYYMAAGGQKIFADPSTITGSIGVIGMIPSLDGMREKWGVSFHTITQSNRASVIGGKKMTAADQNYLQATVEDVYRTFKSRVAASRNMSMEKVEQLAQGRIYTGLQAKENGLVDELGTLKDAFQYAKKVAGLDENRLYPIHRYEPDQFSLGECLSSLSKMRKCFRHHGSIAKSSVLKEALGPEMEDYQRMRTIKSLSTERQTLMLAPIEAKI